MAHLNRIIMVAAGAAVALAMAGGAHAQAAKKGADKAEKPERQEMAAGGTYKCTDADGSVTYTNVGSVKGCKKIEGEVNSISMARPSAPAGAAPAKGGAKVETGSQRVRDTDRKRILEEELAAEEKRLAELKKEFNNGEPERQGDERNYQKYLDRTERLKADVARSEANVDSLKRELGGLRN
jgi:hypothetical protein